MANDWILDVIADLKAFANENGLSRTADQLDDVSLIAAVEIASEKRGQPGTARDERTPGFVY
ncbi:hypothetical protein [Pseudoruegeria sp. HB172150]|uniref:hypothetical protein n=1 Tax=Pseudoruegeria sp. HB172150 TaxID=2721164 RepID=UPI0015551B7A|nr:hypothetical protein [Pseudoruegeria sp. HB172150]